MMSNDQYNGTRPMGNGAPADQDFSGRCETMGAAKGRNMRRMCAVGAAACAAIAAVMMFKATTTPSGAVASESMPTQTESAPSVMTAGPATAPVASRSSATSSLPSYAKNFRRPHTIPYPPENAYTPAREQLGHMLFFDPRVSSSNILSCASCHNPAFNWGDSLPKGVGDKMNTLGRRTPTILNLAWADLLFWDGRADSLESQALGPIASKGEMNMDLDQLIEKLNKIEGYKPYFEWAYPGEGITKETVGKAIATFERGVVSEQAPFDEYIDGRDYAINASAKRGFELFNTKANCVACHSGWSFTDHGFYDIGLPDGDVGRAKHLGLPSMQHAFKTPTLRNVAQRAPYMHDGSEATLEDVVEFYNVGGRTNRPSVNPAIKPLDLTDQEKADLVEFLKTLTSADAPVTVPVLPR